MEEAGSGIYCENRRRVSRNRVVGRVSAKRIVTQEDLPCPSSLNVAAEGSAYVRAISVKRPSQQVVSVVLVILEESLRAPLKPCGR